MFQLSFSPTNPNYLAAGLDKVRGQYSLMIWDVERASQSIATESSFDDTNWSAKLPRLSPRPNNDHGGPLRRYAFADIISSICFLPSTPYLVAVCAGLRFLRIYDIREPSEPQSSLLFNSQTKAHFGLCYDPFDEFKLASYGDDGGVRIWDRRRIDRPVLAFSDGDAQSDASGARLGKTLTHIAFSPARRGTIGTLEKDAFNIRLWSLMEAEPTAVDREQGHEFGNIGTAGMQHLRLDSGVSASSAIEYTSEVADSHLPLLGHTRKGESPLASIVTHCYSFS
jgi:SEA/GATOR complex protein SEA4/MIOS